jgi:hypothetical protein
MHAGWSKELLEEPICYDTFNILGVTKIFNNVNMLAFYLHRESYKEFQGGALQAKTDRLVRRVTVL